MALTAVPVIDISAYRGGDAAARQQLAAKIDRTCRELGFMVISGHGVDRDLIEAVESVSRGFFDLPLDEKMRIVRPAPDVTRGYMPIKAEVLVGSRGGDAPGDLNESLMIGPVDTDGSAYYTAPEAGRHFATNLWPERPAGLRAIYEGYYRVMDGLGIDLMRLFALALGLPEHHFDSRPRIARAVCRCEARMASGSTCRTSPAASSSTSATCWRWTNDRWVSTLHRVVNPPPDRLADSRGQSVVFFQNPNYEALVACLPSCTDAANPPKYPPTTSGGHLREKFVATQQAYA